MAVFTYLGTLATDRDKVRFHLSDTVYESGPRPADKNFTDAEIDGLLTLEGTWQRAVAAGFERLAVEWTRYPSFKADGLSVNRSDIANGYTKQAQQWRGDYPRPRPVYVVGQINKDGYSDDIPNDDATAADYSGLDFEYVRPEA